MRNRASLSPMNLAAPKPMTLAEFLKWEERQDLRYEFDGVRARRDGRRTLAMRQSNAILRWRSGAGCEESPASFTAAISRSRSPENSISATQTEW